MEQLKRYKIWCKEILLKHGKKIKDHSIVFISNDAEMIYHSYINDAIKRVIKKTGIKEITHATILINRNENVSAIAKRLGNTKKLSST